MPKTKGNFSHMHIWIGIAVVLSIAAFAMGVVNLRLQPIASQAKKAYIDLNSGGGVGGPGGMTGPNHNSSANWSSYDIGGCDPGQC